MMNVELDALIDKLSQMTYETTYDGSHKEKKCTKQNQLYELKTRIDERLHSLKTALADSDVVAMKRGKHPREATQQQQKISKDIGLVAIDIKDLTMSCEMNKKKNKLLPQERTMWKDIVIQYEAEYEYIKELAAATSRSPINYQAFDTGRVASPIGSFENGAFTPRAKLVKASTSPGFDGWGIVSDGDDDGLFECEVVTGKQHAALADIKKNDQRFDNIIKQIGTSVEELDVQARMLNEELQQQVVMIDGLVERTDTTQAHVESVNKKMKDTMLKVRCSPDKCMMITICLILLLGISAMLYNMFVKKIPS